jgi:GNAT superfamily N-acetyltransferase
LSTSDTAVLTGTPHGELARRFPDDRPLMLVAEHQGRIVGGGLGFRQLRHGAPGVTLRIIGLEPSARGHGLGRRLMQRLELAAVLLAAPAINLDAASAAARNVYERMGYSGRGAMMSKEVPLPGSFRDARLRNPLSASTFAGLRDGQ